ncbi:MAG: tetratricopeptide repeat protein [Syntrophales bacterium]|jgi:tetratricopeptide (TPR) repeat protein
MLKKFLSRFLDSKRKEPTVEEVVAHVEKGGSFMRVVPPQEEALRANAESLMEQASQHMQQKQYENAADILSEVLRVFPNHFGAYINRGNAYNLSGASEKAIEDYRRAIAINPSYYLAHVNLASVFVSLGRKEDALKLYKDVLSMIPPNRENDIKEINRLIDDLHKYDRTGT